MQYVALFRGINVGSHNRIKMDALSQLFRELGYEQVRTHIQSGNVLFEAQQNCALLESSIQAAFLQRFGFESAVILRSKDELLSLLNDMPFSNEEMAHAQLQAPDVEHVYVYLSAAAIDAARIQAALSSYQGKDNLHIAGREAYLLCYESVRNSKPAAILNKLGGLTARNLGVLSRIAELMQQ